jgi:hypothetical protein
MTASAPVSSRLRSPVGATRRLLLQLVLLSCLALAILFPVAGSAQANSAWWGVNTTARPANLVPGKSATILARVTNIGDATAPAPITITDRLPEGLTAKSVGFYSSSYFVPNSVGGTIRYEDFGPRGVLAFLELCKITEAGRLVTCTWPSVAELEAKGFSKAQAEEDFAHVSSGSLFNHVLVDPFVGYFEVKIPVRVSEEAASGIQNEVRVSGGGAPVRHEATPLHLSEEPVRFGVENYEILPEEEGGALDTRAGSHPFQINTYLSFNQTAEIEALNSAIPVGMPKDLSFPLPAGVLGRVAHRPQCTAAQFAHLSNEITGPACPVSSVVGVANIFLPAAIGPSQISSAVYNLTPAHGEPARFGFYAVDPIILDTALRDGPGEDYGVTVTTPDITEQDNPFASEVVFWGDPGDPRHDLSRGDECLLAGRLQAGFHGHGATCLPLNETQHVPLLTLPASCPGEPFASTVSGDAWNEEPFLGLHPLASYTLHEPGGQSLGMVGCNQLGFAPAVSAEPTTDRASAPSGLDVNLDFKDEGLLNPEGSVQSQLEKAVVMLPEGMTINPSAGVGLGGCTPADYARETLNSTPGDGCPNDSKLGTVEIESPLLTQKIQGSLFIAQPFENPFGSLVAIYIVARNLETGVLIKQAGNVTPNLVTGQLTATFENIPQQPFTHFNFHFREGQQAPLITPSTCGTYATQTSLTPWSDPASVFTAAPAFQVTSGFDGGACPSGNVPPFMPGIASGTLNNNAGAFSSFYLRLTRTDAEQEISGFSTNFPPGLTGDLSGIPFCPEAGIEAARHRTGVQEQAEPSCPAGSQIGRTQVGTGVGAVLAYVPGKVYLAGPFHGAPFSIVSITSAVVGPFDLGTVVLRFGLNIDPNTAQVNVSPTSSESIPTIIDGIVTHVRDIRVYIDRPNFILNPTSCDPKVIGSTLNSNLGRSASVTSPFQDANCANLAFKPSFKVSTAGRTSRVKGASLTVKLTYPKAPQDTQANIAKVKVDLPKQLPSRLTTLQKACTDSTFNRDPAACPLASRVGTARALTPILPVPIEGPAYFVSHGGAKFPELIIVLQGYGVTIDLHGETFISKTGITSSTFRAVPDEPVTSFELTLPQGPNSALAANGNLCKTKLKMPTLFVAQNATTIKQSTPITVTGCPKVKKAGKHKQAGKHAKRK